MKRYLRFGKIPELEKSINWIKLSLDDREHLSYILNDLKDYDLLYEKAEEYCCLEDGVSVFEISEKNGLIIENFETLKDLSQRYNEKVYIVTGDEVGRGNDGEPLIKNIKVLDESVDIDFEGVIIKEIKKYYPMVKSSEVVSEKICEYWDQKTGSDYVSFGQYEFFKNV